MIFLSDVRAPRGADYPVAADSVSLVYADVLYGTGTRFKSYDDSSVEGALAMTAGVLRRAAFVLRPGGVLVLQCDWHLNYLYRAMISTLHPALRMLQKDLEIPDQFEFLNEIIWSYNSGGASRDRVPHKHDSLLVAVKKGASHTFHILREPYPRDYGDRPGFHPEGRMQTSVWYIPRLSNTSKIRTGYDTEKNPELIKRILLTYTNPGDLVLDPCCGSGASGIAALETGRAYMGSDINPDAVAIARARLSALQG